MMDRISKRTINGMTAEMERLVPRTSYFIHELVEHGDQRSRRTALAAPSRWGSGVERLPDWIPHRVNSFWADL